MFIITATGGVGRLPPRLLEGNEFSRFFFISLPDRGRGRGVFSVRLRGGHRGMSSFTLSVLTRGTRKFGKTRVRRYVGRTVFATCMRSRRAGVTPGLRVVRVLSTVGGAMPLSGAVRGRVASLEGFTISETGGTSGRIILRGEVRVPVLLAHPRLRLRHSFSSILSRGSDGDGGVWLNIGGALLRLFPFQARG